MKILPEQSQMDLQSNLALLSVAEKVKYIKTKYNFWKYIDVTCQ